MPLVLAKAFAMIFNTQESLRQQLVNMARAYMEDGLISESDMASVTRLATDLADVPLVTVSDEVAQMQNTFEQILNQI